MPERANPAILEAMLGSIADSPLRGFDPLEDLLGFPSRDECFAVVEAAYTAAVNTGRGQLGLPPLPDAANPETPAADTLVAVHATFHCASGAVVLREVSSWFSQIPAPLLLDLGYLGWNVRPISKDMSSVGKRLLADLLEAAGLTDQAVVGIQFNSADALAWMRRHHPDDWASVFCCLHRVELAEQLGATWAWQPELPRPEWLWRASMRQGEGFESRVAAAEHLQQVLNQHGTAQLAL